MHWDLTIHLGEMLIVMGLAWRVVRALNRLSFLLENFPPHRHVGAQVLYPQGLRPEEPDEVMRAMAGSRSAVR